MGSCDDLSQITVVKVGGSLLAWPGLSERLGPFVERVERESRLVLIAGGGPVVDLVRAVDAARGLGDEAAHRLALRGMDFTAELLAGILPGSRLARRLGELGQLWRGGARPILAPRLYLEEEDERRSDRLEFSWRVTSDSIAARVAESLKASRLILLKSASAAAGATRTTAARVGLVDPLLPQAARGVERVEVVNLRDAPEESRPLSP